MRKKKGKRRGERTRKEGKGGWEEQEGLLVNWADTHTHMHTCTCSPGHTEQLTESAAGVCKHMQWPAIDPHCILHVVQEVIKQ